MGEGEYNIGMKFLFANQVRITRPPIGPAALRGANWGHSASMLREGREGVVKVMHKRTTPKTFSHAKELHRNMSPAVAKLWKHLRAHQMGMHTLGISTPFETTLWISGLRARN